jgi:hypothetical protein
LRLRLRREKDRLSGKKRRRFLRDDVAGARACGDDAMTGRL